MTAHQIIESGEIPSTVDTTILSNLVSVLAWQLDEAGKRNWEKDEHDLAFMKQRQTLLGKALTLLNQRFGSDGMSLIDKGQSNFRILTVNGFQLLLERVEEDEGWQVIVTVFVTAEARYDEWDAYPSIEAACAFIEQYSIGQAQEFLQRASRWLTNELAKRANPFATTLLN